MSSSLPESPGVFWRHRFFACNCAERWTSFDIGVFAILALYFFGMAAFYYRGLVWWSSFVHMADGQLWQTDGWYGYFYPALYGLSYRMGLQFFGVIVLQALVAVLSLAYALRLLRRVGIPVIWISALLAFIIISPVFLCYAIAYSRAGLSAYSNFWLLILLFECIWCKRYTQTPIHLSIMCGMATLMCVGAFTRPDNTVLALGVLAVLLCGRILNKKHWTVLGLVATLWVSCYSVWLVPSIKIRDLGTQYLIVNLLPSVGFFIHDGDVDDVPYPAALETAYPCEDLKQSWNRDPWFSIPHKDIFFAIHDPKDLHQILKYCIVVICKGIKRHPVQFLAYRATIFVKSLRLLSWNGPTMAGGSTEIDFAGENIQLDRLASWNVQRHWPIEGSWIANLNQRFKVSSPWQYFYFTLPQCLMLVWALSYFSGYASFCVSAAFCLRLLELFFLIPFPFFFYVIDLYILGAFLPFLIWAERHNIKAAA